jgi:Tfp pilus assembly protein PilO
MKNLAVAALLGALVLVLWNTMLYSPAKSKASKANSAAAAAETRAKSLQTQLKVAQREATSRKDQTAKLEAAVPADPKLGQFLRDANAIATAAGVDWPTVQPVAPVISNGLSSATIGLTVKGSYGQLLDYLHRLTAAKRLFVIDTVNFTASASASTGSNGQSANGPPTGEVFAGPGEPPTLQLQISGRMFSVATPTAKATP